MRTLGLSSLILTLAGCLKAEESAADKDQVGGDTGEVVDEDGDGHDAASDCDDTDSDVHPDAVEVCDEVDNNCDGEVDEGVGATWYSDVDGDGHGDPDDAQQACSQPAETVENGDDCNDLSAISYPDAAERCDDLDNDCDGRVDEDVQYTWYRDADSDGHGDLDNTVEACDPPGGYVGNTTDCDDADAMVSPNAFEICDEVDNDCDGDIDDDAVDGETWYTDADLDGHGDADSSAQSCTRPTGTVATALDCDDSTATISPDAQEVCDGIDNNCDSSVDGSDAVDVATWYADADGDGYPDPARATLSCEQPSGYTTISSGFDCDDGDAAVNPGAEERCATEGVDDDCDGRADESDAADASTYHLDADRDGYPGLLASLSTCDAAPTDYYDLDVVGEDCNDLNAEVSPDSEELCDGIDNDCDGDVDDADADGVADPSTWYLDADSDGYGDPDVTTETCNQPLGYTERMVALDCDDEDADISPAADEVCNGLDDDCDGETDSDYPDSDYPDSDGDGVANCVDESIWADDFSSTDLDDWTIDDGAGGGSSWAVEDGWLTELSEDAYSLALGPDLGELDAFELTVEATVLGAGSTAAGLAFGYLDSDNYWLLRWLDPTDSGGIYALGGGMDLVRCNGGSCTVLAVDRGTATLSVAEGDMAVLQVTVQGERITAIIDGQKVFTYTARGLAPVGADQVGVFSWSNGEGVGFDNLEVTAP